MGSGDSNLEALERIAKAMEDENSTLDLSGLTELTSLPSQVSALSFLTRIDLFNTKIDDVGPLASLGNLQRVDLAKTRVLNIEPLAGLPALTELFLNVTEVTDISPLSASIELKSLNLYKTNISDLGAISRLQSMEALNLSSTKVRDISPIRELKSLTSLDLSDTSVRDFNSIGQLDSLESLNLGRSKVTDIHPLSGLRHLRKLYLHGSSVSDISALSKLINLTALDLGNTDVCDVSPLAALPNLVELVLNGTEVRDLRPLLPILKARKSEGSLLDVSFSRTPAKRISDQFAEIMEQSDKIKKSTLLIDYLEANSSSQIWLRKGQKRADFETIRPNLPQKVSSPIETEVIGGVLSWKAAEGRFRTDESREIRAREAWEELKLYSERFLKNYNLSNHHPLPTVMNDVDRNLGETFEQMRQIGLGIHGHALGRLADDQDFGNQLPVGALPELLGLSAALETFLNLFDDWIAYRRDADRVDAADKFDSARNEFIEFAREAKSNEYVEDVVGHEIHALVGLADQSGSDLAAQAVIDTAQNTGVTIAEKLIASRSAKEAASTLVNRMAEIGDSGKFDEQLYRLYFPIHAGQKLLRPIAKAGRKVFELEFVDRVVKYLKGSSVD